MLDLNDIALFVRVVQHGSFAEAGRQLGIPPNTLSRRIQELEDQLDTRLMQRTTRKLVLTDAGRAFHERCVAAVEGLEKAGQDMVAGSQVPSGLVRVAAATGFFDTYAMGWVVEFLAAHPLVRLEFLLDDATTDLITERVDVAFRGGKTRDPNFIVRQFFSMPMGLFASPAYLDAHGAPTRLADLKNHHCLTSPSRNGRTIWRLLGPGGAEEEVEVTGRFGTNSVHAQRRAAVAGLGIVLLPGALSAPETAAGRLVPVLPRYKRPDIGMSVVYPSRNQVSLAVSTFVTWMVERLSAEYPQYRMRARAR